MILRWVVALLAVSTLALPVLAQEDDVLFASFRGEEGIFARIFDFFQDDYVQYFFCLIGITFLVSAAVKFGLNHSPMKMDQRQTAGIALIIGFAVANGVFFALRFLEVPQAVSVMYGGMWSVIGIAATIAGLVWAYSKVWGS